jgi:hypothetical protein
VTSLLALQLAIGFVLSLFCSAVPWVADRLASGLIGLALAVSVVIATAGVIIGLALFPLSNLIVMGVALTGGILVGRAVPPRFRPFFILLIALSLLDLTQAAIFGGPPPSAGSTPAAGPNSHLIWVNFRVPLPSGHFNIGFADLLLITAIAEHFRRQEAGYVIAALPGIVGFPLVFAVAAIPGFQQFLGGALSRALIPYLMLGWLLAVVLAHGDRRVALHDGTLAR